MSCTIEYFSDCKDALDRGAKCSGIYAIKPDNLPPFDVSRVICNLAQQNLLLLYTAPFRSIVTWRVMVEGGQCSRGEWMELRTSIVNGMTM